MTYLTYVSRTCLSVYRVMSHVVSGLLTVSDECNEEHVLMMTSAVKLREEERPRGDEVTLHF
jgi:hypothetical protein